MAPPFDQLVTFLYAEEPEASWRFYEEVLGLRLAQDQQSCRIYEVAPGARAFLGVCRARGPRAGDDPRREGGVVISFVHAEVDAWHRRLLAAGAEVLAAPAHAAEFGVTSLFFRDPAGYLLEVQRFERADWPSPSA